MTTETRYLAAAWVGIIALIILLFNIRISPARDLGQWNSNDAVTQWYQKLMQPDAPVASCCGESDAYWCDDYYSRDGKAYCKITDDRPDEPRKRPHRDIGQEFEIPTNKLKWSDSDPQPRIDINPTGHGIIFLSRGDWVYCYVTPGGV